MPEEKAAVRWSPATRIAFRFGFSYFALFCFPFLGIVIPDWVSHKYSALWNQIVSRVGPHVLGAGIKIPAGEGAVNNTPYGWVLFLCYVAAAVIATVIWSALDRRRTDYERLHAWLRFVLRFVLASAMLNYGAIKIIPTQMIAPPLGILAQPLGDLAPNYLLWWYVGASPAYETFTGLAELLGGLLLLVPRTTLVGALVCAADMLTVFMLNMCYDVVVKLYSFHLLVIALVLIAPELRRLANLLIFNRRVEPARVTPLFARPRLARIPHVLLFLIGVYLVGVDFAWAVERYESRNRPKSPFHGVWSVETYAIDGREVPLFRDPERWRWVTFGRPAGMSVELMIGSNRPFAVDLKMKEKTMLLRAAGGGEGKLSFTRPDANVLVLDGVIEGRRTRATLRRMAILGPKFHWVRDPEPVPAPVSEKGR